MTPTFASSPLICLRLWSFSSSASSFSKFNLFNKTGICFIDLSMDVPYFILFIRRSSCSFHVCIALFLGVCFTWLSRTNGFACSPPCSPRVSDSRWQINAECRFRLSFSCLQVERFSIEKRKRHDAGSWRRESTNTWYVNTNSRRRRWEIASDLIRDQKEGGKEKENQLREIGRKRRVEMG